jgi:hypothetical protein
VRISCVACCCAAQAVTVANACNANCNPVGFDFPGFYG